MTRDEIRNMLIEHKHRELNDSDEYLRFASDIQHDSKKICKILKEIAHEESQHAILLQYLIEEVIDHDSD